MAGEPKHFENETELQAIQDLPFLKPLRKAIASDLQKMSKLQPLRTYAAIIFDWSLIAAVIALSEAWFNPLTYFITVMLVASRQHAMIAITHEGVHYRISANHRWNNFVSDWLAAFPILFDTEMYRQNHMKHHRHLNTAADPDWVRKVGQPAWSFPVTPSYILKSAPGFILWGGWRDWLNFTLPMTGLWPLAGLSSSPQLRLMAKRAPFYLLTCGVIGHFQLWAEFALYWLVPFFFVFPTFQRIRSIAEHFALPYTHELNSSRNVQAPWHERLFLGPHQLGYHLTHHMFPSVPFYHLKAFNQLLEKEAGYLGHAHQNSAYLTPLKRSMIGELLGSGQKDSSENTKAAGTAA